MVVLVCVSDGLMFLSVLASAALTQQHHVVGHLTQSVQPPPPPHTVPSRTRALDSRLRREQHPAARERVVWCGCGVVVWWCTKMDEGTSALFVQQSGRSAEAMGRLMASACLGSVVRGGGSSSASPTLD